MSEPIEEPRRREIEPLADEEIVRRLEREGFDAKAPEWVRLQGVLIEYGYGVLKGWLISGAIYRSAAKQGAGGVRGLSRVPRDLKLDEDDAHELSVEILHAAMPRFRRTLQTGGWNSDGGANLTTFFVGRCLMELPDAHEKWRREQDRMMRDVELGQADDGRFSVDPFDEAMDSVLFDELFCGEHEHVTLMVYLSLHGYTTAEISEIFTMHDIPYSENAVRSRISRAKGRARKKYARGERGGTDD